MTNPELIEAYAALAWPLLAVLLIAILLPTAIRLVRSRGFGVKIGNIELTVQEASDQFTRRLEDLQSQILELKSERAVDAVPSAQESQTSYRTSPARNLLWVDDNPSNNASEMARLQDYGYEISTAESTETAMVLLKGKRSAPAAIISDMGRREGISYRSTAGLDLLKEIRSYGLDVPVIFYTSRSAATEHRSAVLEGGGTAITHSPTELFSIIKKVTA